MNTKPKSKNKQQPCIMQELLPNDYISYRLQTVESGRIIHATVYCIVGEILIVLMYTVGSDEGDDERSVTLMSRTVQTSWFPQKAVDINNATANSCVCTKPWCLIFTMFTMFGCMNLNKTAMFFWLEFFVAPSEKFMLSSIYIHVKRAEVNHVLFRFQW